MKQFNHKHTKEILKLFYFNFNPILWLNLYFNVLTTVEMRQETKRISLFYSNYCWILLVWIWLVWITVLLNGFLSWRTAHWFFSGVFDQVFKEHWICFVSHPVVRRFLSDFNGFSVSNRNNDVFSNRKDSACTMKPKSKNAALENQLMCSNLSNILLFGLFILLKSFHVWMCVLSVIFFLSCIRWLFTVWDALDSLAR